MIYDRDTKKSRGFAFVVYSTPEEAARAVDELRDIEVKGRRLRIVPSQPKGMVSFDQSRNGSSRDEEAGYGGYQQSYLAGDVRSMRSDRGYAPSRGNTYSNSFATNSSVNPSGINPLATDTPDRDSDVCFAFQRGYCKFGTGCRFSHDLSRTRNFSSVLSSGYDQSGSSAGYSTDLHSTGYDTVGYGQAVPQDPSAYQPPVYDQRGYTAPSQSYPTYNSTGGYSATDHTMPVYPSTTFGNTENVSYSGSYQPTPSSSNVRATAVAKQTHSIPYDPATEKPMSQAAPYSSYEPGSYNQSSMSSAYSTAPSQTSYANYGGSVQQSTSQYGTSAYQSQPSQQPQSQYSAYNRRTGTTLDDGNSQSSQPYNNQYSGVNLEGQYGSRSTQQSYNSLSYPTPASYNASGSGTATGASSYNSITSHPSYTTTPSSVTGSAAGSYSSASQYNTGNPTRAVYDPASGYTSQVGTGSSYSGLQGQSRTSVATSGYSTASYSRVNQSVQSQSIPQDKLLTSTNLSRYN